MNARGNGNLPSRPISQPLVFAPMGKKRIAGRDGKPFPPSQERGPITGDPVLHRFSGGREAVDDECRGRARGRCER